MELGPLLGITLPARLPLALESKPAEDVALFRVKEQYLTLV
jgi:hypothetical protein